VKFFYEFVIVKLNGRIGLQYFIGIDRRYEEDFVSVFKKIPHEHISDIHCQQDLQNTYYLHLFIK